MAPKLAAGSRIVVLPPFVADALRAHRAHQAVEKLGAGKRWGNVDGLVFTREDGRPLHPNTARYILSVLCLQAAVQPIRFHALRHFAGTAIAEGADIKTAQVALGHAGIGTTADVYVHGTEEMRRRAAAAIEERVR